jgi:predicted glycosyltransferase
MESRKRILLYCHLVLGLGHLMRTLRIARVLGQDPGVDCRVLTGGSKLDRIPFPEGVGLFQLPAAHMTLSAHIRSDDGDPDIRARRRELALEICREWRPDAVLIDYFPLGFAGELTEVFQAAIHENWPTRFVWGIPYPHNAYPSPKNPRLRECFSRFDSVMCYAEPDLLDPMTTFSHYPLPSRIVYTGFVAETPGEVRPSSTPVVVGLTGSGVGGQPIFDALVASLSEIRSAPDWGNAAQGRGRVPPRLRFVVGLHGDPTYFHETAAKYPWVEIWDEGSVEDATHDGSVVVTRSGYNSAFSLIQTPLPIVFVPGQSNYMHGEQVERAEALTRFPNVWMVNERVPGFDANFHDALRSATKAIPTQRTLTFRVNGAENAANYLRQRAMAEAGA